MPRKNKDRRRTKGREVALQMLHLLDFNPDVDFHTIRELIIEQIPDERLSEFCWFIVIGVMERRDGLDARIQKVAQNWTINRMASTDRNSLRIGVYELLHTSTPPRVVIDEAVNLAKRYGTNQSSQFVNGLLDRLVPADRRKELELPVDDEADDFPEDPAQPSEA